ncbi:potassium channel protein [Bacillus sp. FSL W8-0116]|uniref:potassium channel family protein n=1 Tax=Bacillus sp. FSL W8-0116 TaxID=2978206 RepID=UPI0030F6FB73
MNIRKLIIPISCLALTLIIGTFGYMWTEHLSFFDAVWLTVVSVLTIGYGDMTPATIQGKIFTLIIIPVAIGIVTYILARFASAVIDGKWADEVKRRKMNHKIDQLEHHIIVCGLGRVGKQVVAQLKREHQPIVAVEKNEQILEKTEDLLYVNGDATDDDVLIAAGIERASCIVITLPSDTDNVFITLTARGINPNILIVTRAEKEEAEKKLYSAGADKVINTSSIGGKRMAMSVLKPVSMELVDTLLQDSEGAYNVEEIVLREDSKLVNQTLKQSKLRQVCGVTIVAIKRGNTIISNPKPDEQLLANDLLIVFGREDQLRKFEQL